ncbi:hypothetical protein QFZ43_002863 [Streptomyces afghaniensis]|nr:hypothetical protein [Streptomyces afghaniensis]
MALATTQVASGSILGAGLGRRLAEVRWGVAGRMAAHAHNVNDAHKGTVRTEPPAKVGTAA